MNDNLPPIAITGKFRSGKDSAANYLVSRYWYTKFAFGDELKRYYHELFGDTDVKPREGYQWFGQTMRERDPDIWVRKCFDEIAMARYEPHYSEIFPFRVVISDLRQPNEYDRCRAEGFVIIRVNCPDEIRIRRARATGDIFTDEDLRHETEKYVDTFLVDYEVYNTGSLGALCAQIDGIMAMISGEVGG